MDFSQLTQDKNIQLTGIIIGVIFIAGNLFEFIYSQCKNKNYYSFQSIIINFSLALLQQLTDVFNKVIFFLGFYYVQQHYSIQQLLGWKSIQIDFPFAVSADFPFFGINIYMLFVWLFILIVADFCQYWLHRLSHEVNILWAGHIVHHSMEAYNYSVALRQSFIESIYTWIFYLPLAFFGVPWQLFIMAYSISLIWQFFVHTRLINRMGFLENIFMTPSHHRVHHGRNPQYLDKNYGALFVFWDKLFDTFEPEMEAVDYGITVPVQTQNPIWINVHQHLHIFKLFFLTNGFKNKFKVVFGRPDFVPTDSIEIFNHTTLLPSTAVEKLPILKNCYIFLNFLLSALSGFLLVNYYHETQNWLMFIPFALLVAFSFTVNIALLENKKWADYAEVFRLFIFILVGIVLNKMSFHQTIGITIAIAAGCLLLFTLLIARSYQQGVTTSQK